ncbi:MAG: hydrogenase expression/formation protein HypE [Deltaproteobacteria bacterium]|nr:hydrogenase expression/formation protein HypE [Deltaproteobacteria bacterium]
MRNEITLNHGSGGRQMHELIEKNIKKVLGENTTSDDSAVVEINGRVAFTTDSYVVDPLFFPGGNIGALAVSGTVNDLLTCGAYPKFLSLALIIEDGFSINQLDEIIKTIAIFAKDAGIRIVTGDTKVVERGKGDGIFINTAGVGSVPEGRNISSSLVKPGDIIMVTGDMGTHEMAMFKARENPPFELNIVSDVAPLNIQTLDLLRRTSDIHCIKDPTRGGLASALHEISTNSSCSIEIDESSVPVHPQVAGACALLGFDPLYMANEGKFIITGEAAIEEHVKNVFPDAVTIGKVTSGSDVYLKTEGGGIRRLGMLETMQLPRIC